MKNLKNIFQKTLIFFLLLTFVIGGVPVKKAHAFLGVADTGDAILGAMFSQDTVKNIKDGIKDAKDLINEAMVIYQNTLAAKQLVQTVKNFDAATFAKNASGDALNQVGDAVMKNLGITKDQVKNIYTQGSQIVTDFGNYLDKVSINEIKKSLSDIRTTANTTPYTSEIYKSVAEFTRRTADTSAGKIVSFTLPYITKSEICNSPTLKDVIQNGQPEDFVRAKKPVGNVDINKLCNVNLNSTQEGARAQATFVALAKEGYGGEKTREAISDYSNTPSGVVAVSMSNILARRDKVVDTTARQTEATGMFLGDQKCVDKDGKEVRYNPNDPTQHCERQASSAQGSGAVLREKVSAAATAPYQSIVARMDAIHNKLKSGDLTGAADAMALASSILGMGRKDLSAVINDPYDNPYKSLATSLDSLQKTQNVQEKLWSSTEEASREFNFGSEKYTFDDLQNTLQLYENIRIVNTEKLNAYSYTYLILKTSVDRAKVAVTEAQNQAMKVRWWQKIFYPRKSSNTTKSAVNKADAAKKLTLALIRQTVDTRELIKEMAKNNFHEQQMRKLLLQLRDTKDVDTENNQEALQQVLEGTYTEKDYGYLIGDWQYIPEYTEVHSDPFTAVEEDASYYVPTRAEIEGPYTQNLLRYLRARAFLMLRDSLKAGSPSTIPSKDIEMFKAYGIKSLDYLDPNLPRPSRTNTAVLEPDTSKTFSELSYCNQIKIGICNNAELQILTNSLKDYTESTPPIEQPSEDPCISPETSIRNVCAQATSTDDLELRDLCKDETSIQNAIRSAIEECKTE